MFRDALLVAGKDLRIERHSKVTSTQVLPFALLVLVLFAFALDNLVIRDRSNSRSLVKDAIAASTVSAGLFWLAVLFSMLLAIQRSFAIEIADNGRDGLRLSSLDPAGIFLGKAAAIAVQLLVLEIVLIGSTVVFFDATVYSVVQLTLTCVLTTIALVAVGACHGALSAGLRVRDTLMPLLYFPIVSPVLVGAVRATQDALSPGAGEGYGWLRLIAVFAGIYTVFGIMAFGAILEEA
jgi:heme exporter protein B